MTSFLIIISSLLIRYQAMWSSCAQPNYMFVGETMEHALMLTSKRNAHLLPEAENKNKFVMDTLTK